MLDTQTLKAQVRLLDLAGHDTQLKKVAKTHGGEWAGPCPFCPDHGDDRFRVQPYSDGGGIWMCRICTGGKWQDSISYVMRRDGSDFKQACETLGGGKLPETKTKPQAAPPAPAYDAPDKDWQACARRAIETCHKNLFEKPGDAALDYLLGRGISEPTMRYFLLGYSHGFDAGGVYIPRGVVIPCIAGNEVWYLKIALLPGGRVKCGKDVEKNPHYCEARKPCPVCGEINKYRGVRGNRTAAIFNAEDLFGAKTALFVEGEFDVMAARQELAPDIAVCTAGSSTNHLDLATWGVFLLGLETILVSYDADAPGQAGAKNILELSNRARSYPLPAGYKDANEFYMAGGDLQAWIAEAQPVTVSQAPVLSHSHMLATRQPA